MICLEFAAIKIIFNFNFQKLQICAGNYNIDSFVTFLNIVEILPAFNRTLFLD